VIFNLRTFEPGDFETLYEIDRRCFAPEIAYSRRELRNYLGFPGVVCVVALNAKKAARLQIVGFCIAVHSQGWGHLVTMDVLPEFRRHGVGSKLLAETERRLASVGVMDIGLETATTNESAIAFWEKHGYRKYGIHEEYYPDGQDAYEMAKKLNPQNSGAPMTRAGRRPAKRTDT
jgi:ribosomal-protein-alanine N-acetyltransferase